MSCAVAVSVHAEYLKFLPEALDSVDRQTVKPGEKWLICDGCDYTPPAGWKIVHTSAGAPGPGRTEVIGRTGAEWVAWLDADDVFLPDHMAEMGTACEQAADTVGFVYPDLFTCSPDLRPVRLKPMKPWDFGKLRDGNFVPTPSFWRVQALRDLGGWPGHRMLDDWDAALELSRLGWTGVWRPGTPVQVRVHGKQVTHRRELLANGVWQARRLAIVTLQSGITELLGQWLEWLDTADLPPRTLLFVGDNSPDPEYSKMLRQDVAEVAHRFQGVTYRKILAGIDCAPGKHAPHSRVPGLYNQFLAEACNVADLVLLLEDDMDPPRDGVRRLADCMMPCDPRRIGAVAGVYLSRGGAGNLALSVDPSRWRGAMMARDLKPGLNPIGQVPGGFTLFDSRALAATLPFRWTWEPGGSSDGWVGWDGNCCRKLNKLGWTLWYHGDVRCAHCPSNFRYNGSREIARLELPPAAGDRACPRTPAGCASGRVDGMGLSGDGPEVVAPVPAVMPVPRLPFYPKRRSHV